KLSQKQVLSCVLPSITYPLDTSNTMHMKGVIPAIYEMLFTYNDHWFLYWLKDNPSELQISPTLSLDTLLPVHKAYAYLAHIIESLRFCLSTLNKGSGGEEDENN
ncbi:6347_t:CDS:2, partial [Funneliformis mosseae]